MERKTTMRKNAFVLVRVAGLFAAATLLASCYAPIANQSGHLNFNVQMAGKSVTINGTSQAVVLVADSGSQASLAEILYLISKSHNGNGGLSGSEADRLTTLAKEVASSGLVKIGGYPFLLVSLKGGSTTGSFEIPGIPAGRSYFVKLFVLNSTVSSFTAKDVDQNFSGLIQFENPIFTTESYVSPNWQSWVPSPGQPVTVNAGTSAPTTLTLGPLL
jgi:hypothetical protein